MLNFIIDKYLIINTLNKLWWRRFSYRTIVNNDGDAIMGDCNFRKSAAITKALTREYGLTFGKGKKNVRRERLKGKDVIKYRIYDEVNASLKSCSSWQDLCKVLSPKGISLDFVRDSNGSVRGVTFTDNESNVTFAGGKIDHSLSFDSINQFLETANVIGAAAAEMLLQPHIVPSSSVVSWPYLYLYRQR